MWAQRECLFTLFVDLYLAARQRGDARMAEFYKGCAEVYTYGR